MSQYSLIVNSAGASVRITSDKNEWIDQLRNSVFLKRYIPAAQIDINKENSSILELKVDKPHFRLFSPKRAVYSNIFFDEKDIVSIIEYLLEYVRNSLGSYCLHASGAVFNSKGVIFWGGASGMGKTRMTLALNENYGAKFYSDEKIILNLSEKIMVGGISSAYLSKPFLKDKYKSDEFMSFDPIYEHIPIGLMVHVYVEDSLNNLYIEKWSHDKFNWHLYEELSRKIRGTSRRLFDNSLPILSIDRNVIAKKRCDDVNKFTKETDCYYMRGNENELCKKITELLKS